MMFWAVCGVLVASILRVQASQSITGRAHPVQKCSLRPYKSISGSSTSTDYSEQPFTDKLTIFIEYEFSCLGEITEWQLYASGSGTIFLSAWRLNMSSGLVSMVGQNEVNSDEIGHMVVEIPESERIHVEPGDVLGIFYPNPNDTDYVTSSGVIHLTPIQGNSSKGRVMVVDGVTNPIEMGRTFPKSLYTDRNYLPPIMAIVGGHTDHLELKGNVSNIGCASIKSNDTWGTVCDQWADKRGWPYEFCEELGFPACCKVGYCDDATRKSIGAVHLIDPNCKPSENTSMFHCRRHDHDDCNWELYSVKLTCAVRAQFRQTVLDSWKKPHLDDYLCSQERFEGIPMFFKETHWGYICDSQSNMTELLADDKSWPHAFCHERGYNLLVNVTRIKPGDDLYPKDKIDDDEEMSEVSFSNPKCNVEDTVQKAVSDCVTSGETCDIDNLVYIKCGTKAEEE